jgi:uncharacterized protein
MSDRPRPVAADERIIHLDVLRGLAILGILLVNAPAFGMPMQVIDRPTLSPLPFEAADQTAWWVMTTFFHGKFVTLFSMLFGVSLFLVGGERRTDPERDHVLRRRLLWLILFGVLHGALIWFGDILTLYGLMGLIMLLCRSWRVRRLLVVGGLLFLLSTLLLVGGQIGMQLAPPEVQAEQARQFGSAAEVRERISDYQSGLAGSHLANLKTWSFLVIGQLIAFGPMTLGLMMWGLALFKLGVLQGRAPTRTYVLMAAAGAAALAVIGWNAQDQIVDAFPSATFGFDALPNFTLAAVVTLGYIGTVNLALRGRLLRPVFLALAPVGRMAFTNYIAQSLIMTTIFYAGRGLGLYGRLDWAQWSAIVAAVWLLQLIWSPLWLSRFTMGPLEWVWRRLSYGRPLALRRSAPERSVVPA